jgi:hypothetical protein
MCLLVVQPYSFKVLDLAILDFIPKMVIYQDNPNRVILEMRVSMQGERCMGSKFLKTAPPSCPYSRYR